MTPDPTHVAPEPEPGAGRTPDAAQEAVPWEMIEAGRYRPRRIRGSFRGRELG
jgi:hypothetical protein